MNILKEYFTYKITAKGRHGVHSPFVYDFVDKVIPLPIPASISQAFEKYSHQLEKDEQVLHITDLGAGSKYLAKQRKVKDIAKISGTSKKYGKLLYRIASHYKPGKILELGTSLGKGTFMLGLGNPTGLVHTVEACPATVAVAKSYLASAKVNNIIFHTSSFKDYLIKNKESYDLIFIDGDHRSEKLLEQLDLLKNFIHDETIIILDDIRWTADMLNGWKKLVASQDYNLSIDLFRMGILMKRTHQQKEHFIVNY